MQKPPTPQERYQAEAQVISGQIRPVKRFYAFLFVFPTLMALWVVLSGRFDAFHLILGVISCALVSFLSGDLLFPHAPHPRQTFRLWWRFPLYVPWLLYQIFLANLHLLYLTFHPRMLQLIDPHMVRFRSTLKSEMALLTFANSITLTPGTITVRVSPDGDFVVHAIDRFSGEALPGEMEKRVARTFGED
ncbi:MAG: Na+/H+ antiporter subunit E [Proteobacteria bacterium]|nr:Na+/H+ antiporter subunit E [Pseudomonadota bacterium]MBU1449858.1 Na+/H+ antiporter subunit E [Pseudomonadota bacterium]MBU2469617.1 Na+/H+ antiporter subunit E [Pseudomonadota bacterium]MBU2516688.1 Na+/H+ antiporter subunit E [Pseudomonadota bacterium]